MTNIQVQHNSAHAHPDSGFWQVVRAGVVLKKFFSPTARSDAHDYARDLADDARWNASNRDEG